MAGNSTYDSSSLAFSHSIDPANKLVSVIGLVEVDALGSAL